MIIAMDINAIVSAIERGAMEGAKKGAFLIEREAKKTAPIDTSRYRNSIYTNVDMGRHQAYVSPRVYYAAYLEFGTGKYNVVFALGIAFIPSFARIVRGEFIKYRDMDYVKSARLAGVGNLRIMFVHILPNTLTVLVSSIMIGFNNAVLAEAGMSYLGIGVQPPNASLGSMLSEAQSYLFSAPNYAIFPGVMIILLVLGFSLLAEGIKS